MKKIVSLAFVMALSVGFVACGDEKAQSSKDEVSKSAPLRVGATPVPAAEILEFIKPQLQAKGVEIQIQNFTDYVVPNTSLAEGKKQIQIIYKKL